MTSSVDPTGEIAAIITRLQAQPEKIYEGVEQGTQLDSDGFGRNVGYRDLQPGSVIPSAQQRQIGAHEQAQPHVWAFQIAHVAPTRTKAREMATATDIALIGWQPTVNSGPISTFYFVVYDEFAKNGERVQWVATRFYELTLGMKPDYSITT